MVGPCFYVSNLKIIAFLMGEFHPLTFIVNFYIIGFISTTLLFVSSVCYVYLFSWPL